MAQSESPSKSAGEAVPTMGSLGGQRAAVARPRQSASIYYRASRNWTEAEWTQELALPSLGLRQSLIRNAAPHAFPRPKAYLARRAWPVGPFPLDRRPDRAKDVE